MRWPDVWQAIVAEIEGDPTMVSIIGEDGVFKDADGSGNEDFTVPALHLKLVSYVFEENFEQVRIQCTLLTRTDEDLVAGEQRLHQLFGLDTVGVIGGLELMCAYGNSRSDVQGLPDGIRGSSTDFVFRPERSRYVWAADES